MPDSNTTYPVISYYGESDGLIILEGNDSSGLLIRNLPSFTIDGKIGVLNWGAVVDSDGYWVGRPIVGLDSSVVAKFIRSDVADSAVGPIWIDNNLYTFGRVGIGTAFPASDLHINGSGVVNTQFTSTGNNSNVLIQAADGYFSRLWFGDTTAYDVGSIIYNHTTNSLAFTVNSSTALTIDSAGNITIAGTLDGRDIAADGIKLDGIESGADVTDFTNVQLSGAVMDSELTDSDAVKSLDQGVATTDSPMFAKLGLGISPTTVQLDQLGSGLMHRIRSTTDTNAYARYQGTTGIMAVGIVGGIGYVGTTDSSDLRFVANSTEVARFDEATGFFGLGTAFPASNLHVEDAGVVNTQFTSTGNNSNLLIQAADGYFSRLWFGDTTAYDVGSIIYNHTGNYMAFTTNASEALRIDSAGYIGIGTTTPTELLSVNGNIQVDSGTVKIETGQVSLSFPDRATLVSYWSDGHLANGAIISDGTSDYIAVSGSSQISDLPGLEYYGRPTPYHFGAVGDGTTDDTTAMQEWADELRINGGDGLIPAGNFKVSTLYLYAETAYNISGISRDVSKITISNPDRTAVGLKLTHTDGSTRNTGLYTISNFTLISDTGNKACLLEHINATACNFFDLKILHYTGSTAIRLNQVYNGEMDRIAVWGAGHNVPYKDTGSATFTISSGSTTLTASSSVFTVGDVGKKITLISGSGDQTFTIASYTSGTQVEVDSSSVSFSGSTGSFAGVRGSMTSGSTTLTLESDVLDSDDIGRVVYVLGAGPTVIGSEIPLRSTIQGVAGTSITLADSCSNSVTLAELIFDPAVDFGNTINSYSDYTNDFSVTNLMVEQYRGTGLVASGAGFTLDKLKLHATGGGSDSSASNIQGLFSYFQGYVNGRLEQTNSGNLARIVIAGGTTSWAPSFDDLEILTTNGMPLFHGQDGNGAIVSIGNIKTIGNANIDLASGLYSGDGSVTFTRNGTTSVFVNGNYQAPLDNDVFYVDFENERFGIGTKFPQSQFHIQNSGNVNAQITSGTGNANFLIQAEDGFFSRLWLGDNSDYDIGTIEYNHSINALIFKTNNAEGMRIDNTGALILNGPFASSLYDSSGSSIIEVIQDNFGNDFIVEGEGINITYNDGSNTLTIDAELATISNKGVASFDSSQFEILSGHVTVTVIDGGTY